MSESTLDLIARMLGDSTTRRAGILAALGIGAADVLAGDRAESQRKRGERRDRRRAAATPGNDNKTGIENGEPGGDGHGARAEPGRRSDGAAPAPAARPGLQGPCGDGSKADNSCAGNSDCCTNYCVNKRCRCKSRGLACATRKECCRGLVCTAGACSEPAAGPTGPGPAPTGPTGPTGLVPSPTGPTGAVIYNQGGAFGSTSALFYDYAGSGNLGIGVTGPAARLHVAGTGPTGPVQILQGAQGNAGPIAYFWNFDGSELARITVPHKDSIYIGYQTNFADSGTTSNTALGSETLKSQTSGYENTAIGFQAAKDMTTGHHNTVMGAFAHKGGTGSNITAIGSIALLANTGGDSNTAIGSGAINIGESGSDNTAVGYAALVKGTGSQMTALGKDALNPSLSGSNRLTYNNVTGIGYNAQVTGSDQVQLGDTNVTVYAQSNLQTRSDRRDKTDIRDTVLGLAFIEAIRPVDYRWDMRDDYRLPGPGVLMPDASDDERAAHEAASEAAARTWDFSSIVPDGTHRRTRFHHGVIAQEVRDVMERLGIEFGGFQDHTVNGGQDVLSVGYSEFIAPLIRAVQELAEQNRELAARFEEFSAGRGA